MTMTTIKEREILLIFRIWASGKNCGWRCAHLNQGGGEAICNIAFDKEVETEGFVEENILLKRANDGTNRLLRTARCIQAEKDLAEYREQMIDEPKEQPGDKEFFDELIDRQFGDDARLILFKDDFVFIGYHSKPNRLGIFKYAFGRLTEIEPSLWGMLNQMFVWKSIDEKTCHEIAGVLIKYTRDEKESNG